MGFWGFEIFAPMCRVSLGFSEADLQCLDSLQPLFTSLLSRQNTCPKLLACGQLAMWRFIAIKDSLQLILSHAMLSYFLLFLVRFAYLGIFTIKSMYQVPFCTID